MSYKDRKVLAYLIGIALGDGNLSNPNGRAIRLRITCDARYTQLAEEISRSIGILLPKNKISIVRVPSRTTFFNISVYSNRLAVWLPWRVGKGTKLYQKAHVPTWIRENLPFSRECLRGLLQTDGSIYRDRGYLMVNFTNHTKPLADDVYTMIKKIGYEPTFTSTPIPARDNMKYTVRVARNAEKFIQDIRLTKS